MVKNMRNVRNELYAYDRHNVMREPTQIKASSALKVVLTSLCNAYPNVSP